MTCLICSGKTALLFESETNISVSSDCKVMGFFPQVLQCKLCGHVQKALTDSYFRETERLYENYAAYDLTAGREQRQYVDSVTTSRTESIVKNTNPFVPKRAKSWLDVGTGSGVMLRTLSKLHPKMALWGQDVSSHNSNDILDIPGVNGFFEGETSKILHHRFDVISASHVLEHVNDPKAFLEGLSHLLSDDGVLIIQVPNILTNPFDLCIFDHISHFQPAGLKRLLSNSFQRVYLPEKQIFKEITVVASNSVDIGTEVQTTRDAELLESVNLDPLIGLNRKLLGINSSTAVFSTGPTGVYAGACLGNNLHCFIDEDELKIGKSFVNVPIVAPTDFTASVSVISPLTEKQNNMIMARHNHLRFEE